MTDAEQAAGPRIAAVSATPFPDGRRVGVSVDIADVTEAIHLDIEIRTAGGRFLGAMFVVELRDPHVEITIHYRGELPAPGEQLVAQTVLLAGEAETDRAATPFIACSPEG